MRHANNNNNNDNDNDNDNDKLNFWRTRKKSEPQMGWE